MFIIYDIIFLIFSLIYLPVYLCKGKFHRGFAARTGILAVKPELDRPIWIHAVSVGEAMAVKGLVEELRRVFPDKKFVISTVTPTGNKIARAIAGRGDFVTYLPLDFSFIVSRVVKKINPSLFIIVETEIWPNLISKLYRSGIPVVTVNGRLSDSSFRGYLMIKFLLAPLLNKITLFCTQSERDAARFARLGVNKEKIKVTGNMKFDAGGFKIEASELIECRRSLSLAPSEKLLVCGSTHRGEEEQILQVYRELCRNFSGLKLLIAPRHPERAGEVEGAVIKYGFNAAIISRQAQRPAGGRPTVFILDTVGQLLNYYAVSDIVFVGGSLVNKGGHNILEPAFLEKPVLFGPQMSNFSDIADLYLKNNAAIMVHNREELRKNIDNLLRDSRHSFELARRARQVILQNQGATARNIEYLKQYCNLPII